MRAPLDQFEKNPISVFVQNRVKIINVSTDISISYVPSRENSADIARNNYRKTV